MTKSAGKNILIVEDEALLAMELKLLLEEMGHSVAGFVTTGEEALSITERDRPDIVLIDIKLDGNLDGIETSKRIMHSHNIPVIFITGNTDHDTLKRANALNPVGTIKKPLNDDELRSVIKKAFL